MEYVVIGWAAFLALLAYAPKQFVMIGLGVCWAGGILSLLWAIGRGLFGLAMAALA